MEKSAVAILYSEKIIVYSLDRTVAGFWIASDLVSMLPRNAGFLEIGESAKKHLKNSTDKIKIPLDWKLFQRTFLSSLRMKSYKEYMKNAACVELNLKGDVLTITPTSNGGTAGINKGFHPLQSRILDYRNLSDQKLGDEIKAAWEKCFIHPVN